MAGVQKAGVIDVHAHVVLAETFGAAGPLGPEMGGQEGDAPWFRVGDYRLEGVRYAGSAFMDPAVRLARMQAAGIDFQLLSPNPLTYLHHSPTDLAVAFCRRHNDALARLLRAYPAHLAGLAALPMQDIGAAVEELHRAVNDLGLWGAQIGTDMPQALDDPAMDRLYEACIALDVPLFLHPGPAGIDGPAGDPNLKDFDLDVVIGFAAQETLAVARLIFGGVLDRHPALDLCLSHGGGATAFLAGRMAQAMRKRPWSPPEHRKEGAFEQRLARLWFDNHLNRGESLALLTALVGEDRLVFGTNFAGWDAPEDLGAHRPPARLADNARRLLRKT